MATTGLWKIASRLDKVIDYIGNAEKTHNEEFLKELHNVIDYAKADYKTEKQYYVSALNCGVDTAFTEMIQTKNGFGKTNGILGYHGFQSFKEGEVTPEIAHEIGVRLAEEMWGDRFEVVISTHLNTNHIHNHFVVNSVSFKDGKKYYDKRETQAEIRHISDSLCAEYGLSVLEEKPCRNSRINYANYYKGVVARSTYHSTSKSDIDLAIGQAYDYKDFLNLLRNMNYEITCRYGKLSVKRPPYKRNIRIERSFGEEYSIENIIKRIKTTTMIRDPFPEAKNVYKKFISKSEYKKNKVGGIYGLYLYYCYLLKIFPQEYPTKRIPPSIRADVKIMDQISEETRMLSEKKIKTYDELKEYKNSLENNLSKIIDKKEDLWKLEKNVNTPDKKESIKQTILELNMEANSLRKEIKLCSGVEERLSVMLSKVSEIDKEEVPDLISKMNLKSDKKEDEKNEHIK